MNIYEVEFYVTGPITIAESQFRIMERKGFDLDNPFYSSITIRQVPAGVRAIVTARASNEKLAFKAAHYFFGKMLDVLALKTRTSLYLSFTEGARRNETHTVRRVIKEEEFQYAFKEASRLGRKYPSALKGLGYYRKGLYTEDPIDRYLALWNAIETIASSNYKQVPGVNLKIAK